MRKRKFQQHQDNLDRSIKKQRLEESLLHKTFFLPGPNGYALDCLDFSDISCLRGLDRSFADRPGIMSQLLKINCLTNGGVKSCMKIFHNLPKSRTIVFRSSPDVLNPYLSDLSFQPAHFPHLRVLELEWISFQSLVIDPSIPLTKLAIRNCTTDILKFNNASLQSLAIQIKDYAQPTAQNFFLQKILQPYPSLTELELGGCTFTQQLLAL